MGYGAFYVICPRASSQYVMPLTWSNLCMLIFMTKIILWNVMELVVQHV